MKQKIKWMPHQSDCLDKTKHLNKVAYYLDMGLGKTFVGAEKAWSFDNPILVVCQKSKVDDWIDHFKTYYTDDVQDCTKPATRVDWDADVLVINYDIVWRRSELLTNHGYTLLLDESSSIKNEKAKRTKIFIGSKRPKIIPIDFDNVILLSGTPTGGKYEELVTQSQLLGWDISKDEFWSLFIKFYSIDTGGWPVKVVSGYKNVGILKKRLREYGAIFMKTEEVIDLPEQNDIICDIKNMKAYKTFEKELLVIIDGHEVLGETMLQELLSKRQLCGMYSKDKLTWLTDMLESTEDRVIIFYNFVAEIELIKKVCKKLKRKISMVNGQDKDLKNYESVENSVTLIQYQSGAMGLNLQLANKIIYFTLPLSSELFEQSKKRIHRIGQHKPCFYYYPIVVDSIEEQIMDTLKERRDYTNELFKGRK